MNTENTEESILSVRMIRADEDEFACVSVLKFLYFSVIHVLNIKLITLFKLQHMILLLQILFFNLCFIF